MPTENTLRLSIIRGFQEIDPLMPKKYQNPELETREDVKRPYYFVRVSLPRVGKDGVRRKYREEKRLGFTDEISHKKAMEIRGEVLKIVNAGRFVVQSEIRFKDLAARFVTSRLPTYEVPTQLQYHSQIKNHLLPAFGGLKLTEIDRQGVEQLLTAKKEAGLGWWARKNIRTVLSAIYEAARDWKLWEGDKPTLRVRMGRKTFVREKRLLNVEQFRRLLAELPDHLRFLVLILFGLGLRISEALALKWKDIDRDRIKIQYPHSEFARFISAQSAAKKVPEFRQQQGAFVSEEKAS